MRVVLGRAITLVGLLAGVQSAMLAQTVPLAADASIVPGNATNFGSLVNVTVGGVSGTQGLMQFDLSLLPAGTSASDVTVATLRIFANKVGSPGSINVYTANAAWSE